MSCGALRKLFMPFSLLIHFGFAVNFGKFHWNSRPTNQYNCHALSCHIYRVTVVPPNGQGQFKGDVSAKHKQCEVQIKIVLKCHKITFNFSQFPVQFFICAVSRLLISLITICLKKVKTSRKREWFEGWVNPFKSVFSFFFLICACPCEGSGFSLFFSTQLNFNLCELSIELWVLAEVFPQIACGA